RASKTYNKVKNNQFTTKSTLVVNWLFLFNSIICQETKVSHHNIYRKDSLGKIMFSSPNQYIFGLPQFFVSSERLTPQHNDHRFEMGWYLEY
ncbi:hypothetical protein, partial [Streptococcus suis]|uniref:hypothetical protein n=1 Tax=Streptococcus suis TaxID=1307 RepID=UPI001EDF7EB9